MKYNSIRYEDENFRIRVSADSESYIDNVNDFSKVFHEDIEIKCFVGGSSTLHIGTQSVVTEPGDVVFINPYEFHSTVNYAEKKGRYHLLMIGLDFFEGLGDGFIDLRYLFTKEKVKIQTLIRNSDRLCRIICDIMKEVTEKRGEYKTLVRALMLELFVILLRDFRDSTPAELPGDKSIRHYEMLYPAIHLIRQDCSKDYSIDELSALCGVSKSHFCRIFKRATTMRLLSTRTFTDCRLQTHLYAQPAKAFRKLLFSVDLVMRRIFQDVIKTGSDVLRVQKEQYCPNESQCSALIFFFCCIKMLLRRKGLCYEQY